MFRKPVNMKRNKTNNKPPKQNDELLKGAFEERTGIAVKVEAHSNASSNTSAGIISGGINQKKQNPAQSRL